MGTNYVDHAAPASCQCGYEWRRISPDMVARALQFLEARHDLDDKLSRRSW